MIVDINILATSDIHGYYMPWDYSLDSHHKKGSLAQISTIINNQRNLHKNTIVVDIGDIFQGNCSEIFYDDFTHPAIIAMNEIGYDIWEMGNHEYGFGIKNLLKFVDLFNGDVIGANVYKNKKRLHKPYVIIEKQGIKIGFIGLVTSLINKFEKGNKDMSSIFVNDMKEELELVGKELSDKVDCVIGLIHAGVDNENGYKNTGVADLLKDNDSFTAVFCGHFHQLINKSIGQTTILEPGKFGESVAKLCLRFEKIEGKARLIDKESELIYIDESVPIDENIVKKLENFHEKAISYSNEVIGIMKNDNMSYKEYLKDIPLIRVQETALTDFFLEVIRHYGRADISMLQLDNDYAGINKGIIKRKDINKNYTYVSGGITSYEISGRTLKKIVEYSSYFYNESKKGDVNISFNYDRQKYKYSSNYFFGNLKYTIDLTSENRIKNLRYENGNILKDDDKIIFATTKYTMDIFKSSILKDDSIKKIYSTKEVFRDRGSIRNLLAIYIKEVLNGEVDVIAKKNWEILINKDDEHTVNIAKNLISKGYVSIINSEDGRYKNIKAINIYDNVDKFDLGLEKLGIDIYQFSSKGELYNYANKLID